MLRPYLIILFWEFYLVSNEVWSQILFVAAIQFAGHCEQGIYIYRCLWKFREFRNQFSVGTLNEAK